MPAFDDTWAFESTASASEALLKSVPARQALEKLVRLAPSRMTVTLEKFADTRQAPEKSIPASLRPWIPLKLTSASMAEAKVVPVSTVLRNCAPHSQALVKIEPMRLALSNVTSSRLALLNSVLSSMAPLNLAPFRSQLANRTSLRWAEVKSASGNALLARLRAGSKACLALKFSTLSASSTVIFASVASTYDQLVPSKPDLNVAPFRQVRVSRLRPNFGRRVWRTLPVSSVPERLTPSRSALSRSTSSKVAVAWFASEPKFAPARSASLKDTWLSAVPLNIVFRSFAPAKSVPLIVAPGCPPSLGPLESNGPKFASVSSVPLNDTWLNAVPLNIALSSLALVKSGSVMLAPANRAPR